ncbi:hypothetical protein [Pyrinomonas methylaliphatogenes]|uniref:P pilus assembly/Cpx signaling pathway, periplasmic inhibitor/zinc-resistance associated protein n=1 Tax=Pyrinomonas methylaliphatogenes TaxID=454194 RepID=A0A0B6WVR1_9BACT|nr:hypothetical protein [Pyrinomonas methylaliphatogenes]CDM64369.1 hypothetical protein PYK22_00362 [Pyrinomonas methylaliphatogenes]
MRILNDLRAKIWATVIAVFILGCATGAALSSLYHLKASSNARQMGNKKEAFFDELRRDLSLTDEQAAQIRLILDQTNEQFRQLRAEVRPRYEAIRQSARARIRAVLNPEQRAIFDAKIAQKDARRNEGEKDER